jgi:probable F420-dependent oxidoreductase
VTADPFHFMPAGRDPGSRGAAGPRVEPGVGARGRAGLDRPDGRLSRFADLVPGAPPIGRLVGIACLSMARLRFGVVSESVREGRAWLDFARQVEDSGIDVLLLRDHFSAGAFGQQLAPFSGLAAAAAVTTRLRVGTIVLSNDFRHPAIVAHEAASLHLVSGGRFELGIGAGWYQPEYDAAGIAFDAAGQRIARLGESLSIIKDLLAGAPVRHTSGFYRIDGLDLDVLPTPRPGSPRLLVGAGGPRMLRLAARHADIVGVLPAPIRGPADSDDPCDRLPAAFDAKIGVIREAAGDRFGTLEINAFGTFIITGKRRAETADLVIRRGWTGIGVEAVWQMPTVFIGSLDQIRSDLRTRQERFGLSYLIAGEDSLPALAEIVSGL